MKIRFAPFLVVALIFFFVGWISTDGLAAVIFQDDFESSSSIWKCTDVLGDGPSSKWSSGYTACGSTTGFGAEWKMGLGYNSTNALYAWKKQGVPNGYRSESQRWLTGSDVKTEIYHRWYMKVPASTNFNKAIAEGFKLWRYITRENGYSNPPEIYLNVSGSTFASGKLVVLLRSSEYLDLVDVSAFNDNQWHCHELRIKLNSNGQSDGIIQYWLDGVLKASFTNRNMTDGGATNLAIHRFGVGIGNVSDSDWYQSAWSAIAFDNIVLSTDYVGPIGGSPSPSPSGDQTRTIYLNEGFDDTNYVSRGWYDYSAPVIDTNTKYSGSGSLRHDFPVGSNGPTGVIRRHAITASDSVYVRYFIRFGSGWQGFGTNSPHMAYLLTTGNNDAYSGLAWTKTLGYIEVNGSTSNVHVPTLKLQDSENINTGFINQNTCSTESRAVNGCNGNCDGHSSDCYQSGGYWYNGRAFTASTSQVVDTNWHKVEAYFKMNTISGGVGQANGQLKMWWDGVLVVNHEDLIIRTAQNSTMQWNQIIIAPWGAASPIAQTFWIDDLEVANLPPSGIEPTPPSTTPPSAPSGLRIMAP